MNKCLKSLEVSREFFNAFRIFNFYNVFILRFYDGALMTQDDELMTIENLIQENEILRKNLKDILYIAKSSIELTVPSIIDYVEKALEQVDKIKNTED
jgi:hypothetical protein